MKQSYEIFIKKINLLGEPILCNEPMRKHSTFRIGGPVDFFITVNKKVSLGQILKLCRTLDIPVRVIGNGSNLLISDDGVRGVVLKLGKEFKEMKILDFEKDTAVVECGTGVLNSSFCNFLKVNGLTGAEFLYGIPGTIGGSVRMNAGAYGREIKDIILKTDVISIKGDVFNLNKDQMRFSYRKSCFFENKGIIVSAVFRFNTKDPSEITLNMRENLEKRKKSQPLNFPNAGSVFKRPEGLFASKLIDECGLKGKKIGDAMVSEKHAGFIINCGQATSEDVMKLIEEIKATVLKKKGVLLEEEIEIWN